MRLKVFSLAYTLGLVAFASANFYSYAHKNDNQQVVDGAAEYGVPFALGWMSGFGGAVLWRGLIVDFAIALAASVALGLGITSLITWLDAKWPLGRNLTMLWTRSSLNKTLKDWDGARKYWGDVPRAQSASMWYEQRRKWIPVTTLDRRTTS